MSLPSGYRQLEYIQSSGTQYIDTGIIPTNHVDIAVKFQLTETQSTGGIISAEKTWGTAMYSVDAWACRYNTTYKSSPFVKNVDYTVRVIGKNFYINDEIYFTGNDGDFNGGLPLTLFAVNRTDTPNEYSKSKIYYCKIYNNGILVRDYIPCQTTSGEIGLWDDVNSVFYGNAGTGTFISGGYISLKTGDILNYAYTGAVQSVTLPKGIYKLEVWGAQGGYRSSSSYGGKGGYSVGTIAITQPTNIFIYVGGSGNTGGTSGGFNGGGARHTYKGGGGASDIRIGQDSLYARVIVAGGGGSDGASNKTGMYGGGTTGGSTTAYFGTGGYGGTQTGVSSSSWQTTTHSTSTTSQSGAYAGFGFGGNGIYRSNGYGGAGGGGWYGGSGSYPDSSGDDDRGGGGGSGFVWTGSNAPSGYLLGSEYYLTNASTIAGNASMPSISGGTETGHTGNGYARITAIKVGSLNLPVNIGGAWKDANEAFVNIGGTWKTVEAAFVNIGGTWKELG